FGSPVMSESGSTPGFTLGRSSPEVLPLRDQFDVEIDGENGSPLLSDTIVFSCHPDRNAFDGAGISQVTFAANTWRMSNGAAAQSASGSYGFCAYTDVLTESTFSCACVLSMVLLRV